MIETFRKWLISIWIAGFLVPLVLIVVQNFYGKYGTKDAEVVGWLTALTLPTLLLMIGVMVGNPATAPDSGGDAKKFEEMSEDEAQKTQATADTEAKIKSDHERFIFKLAAGISLFYFSIIYLVFFYEPFAHSKPQELMRSYKIYLALFDSVLSLLIGYFFGKR